MKAPKVKKFIEASYDAKPSNVINGYRLDKELSNKTAKTYFNKNRGEAVVVHRGTQGARDWLNNAAYALGGAEAYKHTARFRRSENIQNKAEEKYGNKNIITIGHSQGGLLARELGKDTKQIISVNPAYLGEKAPKNETVIRSSSDVVSSVKSLRPSANTTTIQSRNPLNVLAEHSPNILDRLGNQNIKIRP